MVIPTCLWPSHIFNALHSERVLSLHHVSVSSVAEVVDAPLVGSPVRCSKRVTSLAWTNTFTRHLIDPINKVVFRLSDDVAYLLRKFFLILG